MAKPLPKSTQAHLRQQADHLAKQVDDLCRSAQSCPNMYDELILELANFSSYVVVLRQAYGR
jgi:hypothetical protein